MSAEGRPYARFRRALDVRSVMQAKTAAREMGRLGLNDALDYLVLLAAEAPDRYDRAARRWLARLLEESPALTLDEVDVALGCLRGVAALYEEQSREVLRALGKRRHESRGQRGGRLVAEPPVLQYLVEMVSEPSGRPRECVRLALPRPVSR
jgi:hypothetical protein